MNFRSTMKLLCSCGVALTAMQAHSAYGQAAEAEQAGTDSAGRSAVELNEIVVTAQFRSQRLQDTPLAISALNSELLEARGQNSIQDVAARAPSVTIEKSSNGGGLSPQLTIRGIGQTDFFPAVEPGVGVYIDDVYYGLMVGSSFDLVDVGRIEVLRGPQGTLSGRNSVGGSIKLFSQEPDFTTNGYAKLSYGRFNMLEARGSVNIPIINDRVALRIGGLVRRSDGWLDRLDYGCANPGSGLPTLTGAGVTDCKLGSEGGQEVGAVRGALKVVWSDAITQTVSADIIRDKQELTPTKLLYQGEPGQWATGYNFITPGKSLTNYNSLLGNAYNNAFSPGIFSLFNTDYSQFNFRDQNFANQWGVSNVFDIDLGAVNVKSITAYRETDAGMTQTGSLSPFNTYTQQYDIGYSQFSQELRLSGEIGTFANWTVGGYYFKSDNNFDGRIFLDGGFLPGGGGIGFVPNGSGGFLNFGRLDFLSQDLIESETKAAFAHSEFHLAPNLNLTLGIRYTEESKDYTFSRAAPDGGVLDFRQLGLDQTRSFAADNVDYRIALDYRFSPDFLAYAQFSTGFKGGGINPRTFFASQAVTFQPEKVKTYELGFKSDLFDRKVRFNAAGFYTDYTDIQLIVTSCPDITPGGAPGPCTATRNAGDSKLWGVEFEGQFEPVEGLVIDATASFLDFQYKRVDAATRIPLNADFPFLAKNKFSGGIQYAIPAFNGTITPRVDVDYRSGFETEALKISQFGTVDGRALVNARLTYRTEDEGLELALGVTNLTNKFYYANKFDRSNAPFFSAQGVVGTPRVWTLSVKRNF